MIHRRRRLARRDFPTLLTRGKRRTTTHFSIVYSDAVSGYAAVVSKKVAKTAVRRHVLKRQILSFMRAYATIPSKGCVVFARQGAATLTYKEITKELTSLFTYIGS